MSNESKNATVQLPLDLSIESANAREDLIESPANAMAIALIDAWPDWPGRVTILAGPVGSGKSHIASVWAQQASASVCISGEITQNLDELVNKTSTGGAVLIENADNSGADETALFHLINAVRQGEGYCLITSRSWPSEWGVSLPDLASRLKAAQVVELQEPDDDLLKQVMMKLFADRQLIVDQKIIDYCVLRMERSLETAGRLVAAIDAEAFARKSGVTKATAGKALEVIGAI